MARAQTKVKKGRASSSHRRSAGTRRRRPTASGMAGSKGKGRNRNRQDRTRTTQKGTRGTRSGTGRSRSRKPEAGEASRIEAGATVAEQRRASSGQGDEERTNRPPSQGEGKPGARGGGPVDRQEEQARGRRSGAGDSLEMGREDADMTGMATRGATGGNDQPRGRPEQGQGDDRRTSWPAVPQADRDRERARKVGGGEGTSLQQETGSQGDKTNQANKAGKNDQGANMDSDDERRARVRRAGLGFRDDE